MHNAAPQNSEASIKEGYEVSDMHARIIVTSFIALMVLMFGACIVIVMIIRGFNQSRQPLNTTPASNLVTPGVQVPVEPHLQGDPVADRIKIDEQNQHQIATFGVVSEEPGMERVHIPVERAMSLVAEGKVPYRQTPQIAAAAPAAPAAPAQP